MIYGNSGEVDNREDNLIAKPFLRWAGGKRLIIQHLRKYIPKDYNDYWEPFLGAGSMFFSISPNKAYLSDLNEDLIMCYKYVKNNPVLIHRYLCGHKNKSSHDYYYRIRDEYNNSKPSAAQAARFIFLNKTNFNGIFRVNRDGKYNVPFGNKESPAIPSKLDLITASKRLTKAKLSSISFENANIPNKVAAGDFLYIDPPYPPISDTANFRHYTKNRFHWKDHITVANIANVLREKGCFVMISNVNIEKVRTLFLDWNKFELPVRRWISANGDRFMASELVITSYPVPEFK